MFKLRAITPGGGEDAGDQGHRAGLIGDDGRGFFVAEFVREHGDQDGKRKQRAAAGDGVHSAGTKRGQAD